MEPSQTSNVAPTDPAAHEDAPVKGADLPVKDAPASAQLRGEVIAYAVQSGICNIGWSLVEPFMGSQLQRQFAQWHDPSHKEKYGTYKQNLIGEFAGDIAGAATLIGLELAVPDQLHGVTRRFRKFVDPLYETVARRVLASHAAEPDFQKQIDEWKTFQERNLSRSLIIATGGIAANLATQKWVVKNPSPSSVVFAGKLVTSAISTSIGLCTRMLLPKQMDKLDEKLSKKFFAPLLADRNTHSKDMVAPEVVAEESHADRLRRMTDAYMRGEIAHS